MIKWYLTVAVLGISVIFSLNYHNFCAELKELEEVFREERLALKRRRRKRDLRNLFNLEDPLEAKLSQLFDVIDEVRLKREEMQREYLKETTKPANILLTNLSSSLIRNKTKLFLLQNNTYINLNPLINKVQIKQTLIKLDDLSKKASDHFLNNENINGDRNKSNIAGIKKNDEIKITSKSFINEKTDRNRPENLIFSTNVLNKSKNKMRIFVPGIKNDNTIQTKTSDLTIRDILNRTKFVLNRTIEKNIQKRYKRRTSGDELDDETQFALNENEMMNGPSKDMFIDHWFKTLCIFLLIQCVICSGCCWLAIARQCQYLKYPFSFLSCCLRFSATGGFLNKNNLAEAQIKVFESLDIEPPSVDQANANLASFLPDDLIPVVGTAVMNHLDPYRKKNQAIHSTLDKVKEHLEKKDEAFDEVDSVYQNMMKQQMAEEEAAAKRRDAE